MIGPYGTIFWDTVIKKNNMYRFSYISDLANWAKSIAIAAVVTAMDFVSPIENFLVVILSLAFIDTFWGLAADLGDFRKSKFIRSWVYMLVYFLIIIISFWIGVMMDISEDNAKAFVSWITWAMIWFYGTNVLKNMGKVFPDNKVIAFLYWVAAVKFISKVNFLDEYNKTKNKKGSPDPKG